MGCVGMGINELERAEDRAGRQAEGTEGNFNGWKGGNNKEYFIVMAWTWRLAVDG